MMGQISKAIKSEFMVDVRHSPKGALVPGREALIEKCLRTLLMYSHGNLVLVGPEGIGKHDVLNSIAWKLAAGTGVPELDRMKLYHLDVEKLCRAAKSDGEVADLLEGIYEEAAQEKDHLFFVKNAQYLLYDNFTFNNGVKVESTSFLSHLKKRHFKFAGVLSAQWFEKDKAFFQEKVREVAAMFEVEEPKPEDCLHALKDMRLQREEYYGVKIEEAALKSCVYLSHRFIKTGRLPSKAVQLLDESISHLKLKSGKGSEKGGLLTTIFGKGGDLTLTEDVVASLVSEKVGVPVGKLTMDEIKSLKNIEVDMGGRIIGQDHVVGAVAQTVRAVRAGFGEDKRPDGIFYFVGPSGVGKTEFALVLADTLFGGQEKLIRVDMSEFVHPADVTRLIGAPPGYVGYDQGGVLTEWAKKNPMSVILLDEFEKANPGCWDVFLQMFDAGRLTDGQGTTVDFSNAIVIMTSNVGSELFAQDGPHVGFSETGKNRTDADFDQISDQIQEKLKKVFRPEFLNRVDEIVVFRPLDKPSLIKIASLMLKKAPVIFQADGSVLDYLATQGYEPQYGARHLRRAIQDLVLEPLAGLMIDGKFKNGDTIQLTFKSGAISFEATK